MAAKKKVLVREHDPDSRALIDRSMTGKGHRKAPREMKDPALEHHQDVEHLIVAILEDEGYEAEPVSRMGDPIEAIQQLRNEYDVSIYTSLNGGSTWQDSPISSNPLPGLCLAITLSSRFASG